jgi:hypothetical protein
MKVGRSAVLALAALTTGASCTMNADVTRWSGPDQVARHEVGRIVRSDEGALYIERDGTGETVSVPRAEVHDVDHPGNVLMVVGGILLGLWAFRMTDSRFRQDLASDAPADAPPAHAVPVTFIFAVPGALLFSAGALFYARSKRAAAPFEHPGAPAAQ